ncbi:amidohydrolase [Kineococcus sp. SYSU DK002]|uniref:amidohydrolase n=1 Tax=Kineococcus sp. SYSU DK002 TaxID=3383123 RepID=UPI003D7CB793
MTTHLRGARLPGLTGLHDVTLAGGSVTAVVPHAPGRAGPGEEVQLDGRFLFPGLWDHHVHFTQWVVTRSRLDLSGARSAADAVALVTRAVADRPGPDPLSGYGFRDGLWPDEPSLAALDAVSGDRSVVLVSGDLHCGWLNSAAMRSVGVPLRASGLLRENEWIAALDRLDRRASPPVEGYRAAAADAAARGVVGVVEFENADNLAEWPGRVAAGVDQLRVEASVWPHRLERAIADGYRTGAAVDPGRDPLGLVAVGRLKVVVDGSLNTRTALCHDPYPGLDPFAPDACGVQSVPPERLRDLLRTARDAGVLPAIHAIGDLANTQVLDAFEELGIAGTVEHAQLVSRADFERFGRLGLTASVQPEHAMDDRDVADRHWAGRTDRAFAFASLHAAGAVLRLGSDAPVSPLDPWPAVAAAVDRSRDGRAAWHPEQRLPREVALAASTRGRLRVGVGDVADLVVLDADPLTVEDAALRDLPVAATLVGGRFTHDGLRA